MTRHRQGRWIGTAPLRRGEPPADLDLRGSLLAGAIAPGRDLSDGLLDRTTLRRKIRVQPRRQTVLLVVDASDSMGEGVRARMRTAKGVALALLDRAYVSRFRVGIIVFRERAAVLLLPPTASVDRARTALRRLGIGGATPLAAGLQLALRTARQERIKHPGLDPLLVVISDGEANVPLSPGADIRSELLDLAGQIAREKLPALLIDAGSSPGGAGLLRRLALAMGGDYQPTAQLSAGRIVELVTRRKPKSER